MCYIVHIDGVDANMLLHFYLWYFCSAVSCHLLSDVHWKWK